MSKADEFKKEVESNLKGLHEDDELKNLSNEWLERSLKHKYSYNFTWLGRPIIQYPQDVVAVQELIWEIEPDLIIETGIAHGGSLILSASMLALLDMKDALRKGQMIEPGKTRRSVLGIDIDIRAHNREAIASHPFSYMISMIEGSSTSEDVVSKVHRHAGDYHRIMIMLDSNHTHEHVLKELGSYASLTSVGSYCIVFDTVINDLDDSNYPDRPWSRNSNPHTAVFEFLKNSDGFVIDERIHDKLQITVAPNGFLKRIR